jgi:hypothetical protein
MSTPVAKATARPGHRTPKPRFRYLGEERVIPVQSGKRMIGERILEKRIADERTVEQRSLGEETRRKRLEGRITRKNMVREQLPRKHLTISNNAMREGNRRRRGEN